jgi:S1-C subfamily serine protease
MKNIFFICFLVILIANAVLSQIKDSVAKAINPNVKILESVIPDSSRSAQIIRTKNLFSDFYANIGSLEKDWDLFDAASLKNLTTTRGLLTTDIYNKLAPTVVLLVSPDISTFGAGCIISEDGQIITNWHVAGEYEEMFVILYEEGFSDPSQLDSIQYYVAKVIAVYPEKDLAMLKINLESKFDYIETVTDVELQVGQEVYAIGHPEGYFWSFTSGIISQIRKNQVWSYDNQTSFNADIIQIQTPINPGNSGGPLINEDGYLVGINSFTDPNSQGINFAIHINEIKKFIQEADEGKHSYTHVDQPSSVDADWSLLDLDTNGIADAEAIDTNGDGYFDIIRYDENEDGVCDFVGADSNYDNIIDIEVRDSDKDGFMEYYLMDSDYDGYYDTEGYDYDKDGVPDEVFKLE